MTRIRACVISAVYFFVMLTFWAFVLSGAGSADYSSPDVWYVEAHSGGFPDWLLLSVPVSAVAACYGALTGGWLLRRLRDPALSSARALSCGGWHGVLVNALTWLSLLAVLAVMSSRGSSAPASSETIQAFCGNSTLNLAFAWITMMLASSPFAAAAGILLAWKIHTLETERAADAV